MLQHLFAVSIGAEDKDIELIIFAVGTPVVLRGLEGIIHHIDPGSDQGRVLGVGGDDTAAAVETGSERAALRGDVLGVSLQCRQRSPAFEGGNVRNIPGE